jgi:hypothetical protein
MWYKVGFKARLLAILIGFIFHPPFYPGKCQDNTFGYTTIYFSQFIYIIHYLPNSYGTGGTACLINKFLSESIPAAGFFILMELGIIIGWNDIRKLLICISYEWHFTEILVLVLEIKHFSEGIDTTIE